MICNYCLNEFEPKHFNQKLCSPECKKDSIRRAKDNYKKTDKGIITNERWIKSDRRKQNEKRYASQPHRKKLAVDATTRYLKSHPEAQEKKRERNRVYARSEHGRNLNIEASARYRMTENGKMIRRITKSRRRGAFGSFSPSEWKEKLNMYKHKCAKCGSPEHIEIDHIRPIALGGTNMIDNIQPLCRSCNASKGARYVG